MFNIAHKGIVAWPMTLTQQQGDAFVDVSVIVRFRVFKRAELRERDRNALSNVLGKLVELVRKQAPPDEIERVRSEMDVAARSEEQELLARIEGGTGFGNADNGAEVPLTREVAAAIIEHEPYYQAFWAALLEASRQAKPKNSLPGADGPSAPGLSSTAG